MSDKISELAGKIADAQRKLDAAELERAPTTRIEADIAALQREHDSLIQAKAEEARAVRQAEDDQIEREAMAEAEAIAARIASVLPEVVIPTPAVDLASIVAATRIHQRARCQFDKAVAVLAEKQKVSDAVAGLIFDHEGTLDRLGDRLMEGAELPSDDMARLKSMQFLERKRPVHQAALAEVAAAQKDVRAADDARKRAHEALIEIDDLARRDGYISRIKALDAQLLEYLGLVAAINKRRRRFEPFICSHELRSTLSRQSIDNPVLAQKMDPASPLNFHLRRITVARQMADAEQGVEG